MPRIQDDPDTAVGIHCHDNFPELAECPVWTAVFCGYTDIDGDGMSCTRLSRGLHTTLNFGCRSAGLSSTISSNISAGNPCEGVFDERPDCVFPFRTRQDRYSGM
jgi:hypothetical protein